jgi:hypothetical protein
MTATTTRAAVPTTAGLDVHDDVIDAEPLGSLATRTNVTFDARRGRRNLWIVVTLGGREAAALRVGHADDDIGPIARTDTPEGVVFEFASAAGALRAKVGFPSDERAIVRCTTSLLPARDVAISFWPRDVYVLGAPSGTIHTAQRGLRTGIVFASTDDPSAYTLFYLQNFSSLTEYFELTKRSPSDTVGGRWPELGYAPPAGHDCVLSNSREVVVSDAFLTIAGSVPKSDAEIAAMSSICSPRRTSAYRGRPSPIMIGRVAPCERCAT